MRTIYCIVALAVSIVSASGETLEYKGVCEASAGAYVDNDHFLVASDETNILRLYKRGGPEPVGAVNLEAFTGFDKSDLEGAAKIGDRVYWISSHSFNSSNEDKKKRRVFFATKTVFAGGVPSTVGVGKAITSLRDGLASAANAAPKDLNVEGLAATPEGGLLIGLRSPLRNGNAIVVPLNNAAAVVEGGSPLWGKSIDVNLDGRGIRSMELILGQKPHYLIMAGTLKDSGEEFKIYKWSGPGSAPERLDGINLKGIKPEGMMQIPATGKLHLISDDGDICSDEAGPEGGRRFRSIEIELD